MTNHTTLFLSNIMQVAHGLSVIEPYQGQGGH